MNNATTTRQARNKHARTFDAFQMFLFTIHAPFFGVASEDNFGVAADWHRKAVR